MRVVYIHQHFVTPTMRGGTRTYEFGRRLVARGHTVQVIASDRLASRATGAWRVSEEAGMSVHWSAEPYDNTMSYGRRVQAFGRFALRAGRLAARLPADVVVASSTPLTVALPGLVAARAHRAPMVFEVRDLWPAVPIAVGALSSAPARLAARGLEQLAYRGATEIIALSPGMTDGVVAAGVAANRVTTIPNACDFEMFQVPKEAGDKFRATHPWLGGRPLVAYTGAISTANDVGWLVDLAAVVANKDPEVRFVVVGAGRERDAVEQRARAARVWERSFFVLPAVEHHEVAAVLSAADLAAVLFADTPVLQTSSPNKAFDAMASGTGILMNYPGWLADAISAHDAGLCVARADLGAAAEALVSTLDNEARLAALGAGAQRLGRSEFDRDRLTDRLEHVLRRAVERFHA